MTTLDLSKSCEIPYEGIQAAVNSIDKNDQNKEYNITLNSIDVDSITVEQIEKAKAHNWNVIFQVSHKLSGKNYD